MEEIDETSKAYYNNLTENQKQNDNKMFLSMDLNGDGSVSISEYVEKLGKMGFKSCNNPKFFMELDRNGDGNLDFEEFLSLYYLIKSDGLMKKMEEASAAFEMGFSIAETIVKISNNGCSIM
ncbi:hypothetical protein FEM48_ZijujUnG0109400 [Ziziphus jujuba var. spinosa]|uniref:EF-hand domain-containing protein n=1 Tax=Ziziphus jujuba var. spinosa TaxID=714518 RepID=A0A978U827_ZIZJJ|nr:hypothetical protein FEM48_ZijujUnG0109400 [Ziziphus jujuba var. spinosa]